MNHPTANKRYCNISIVIPKVNKKWVYLLFTLFTILGSPLKIFSQMKIASSPGVPNQGAMLDVESIDRGFLPPRVYLTGLSMQLSGATPVPGTLIFSTNWSGDGSLGGLFVWEQNGWQRFSESPRIPISSIKVVRYNRQDIISGENAITWEAFIENRQPAGDLRMWNATNPTEVIIRRKGWYFISGSCRMSAVVVGEPRYISIMQNNQQVSAVGFNNPGIPNVRNNVTLNTSVMVLCEVNDRIKLSCYSINAAGITPNDLLTTQMNVVQLPSQMLLTF